MLGEAALEPPSYYFTKPATAPADAGASSHLLPPDGAQRFSLRVRGISVQNDTGGLDQSSEKLKTDTAEPSSAQPSYRMVTKRIRFRRATLPKSLSPWCRSRRRRYRKVIVYIDENGKELSALDMHKRTKAGTAQSTSGEEKTTENVGSDKATTKGRTLSSPGSETRSRRSLITANESMSGSSASVEVCSSTVVIHMYFI